MSILGNIKKRGLKDITNPTKIKNYLDGKKIQREGIHLDYDEILPYAEQLVYRTIVCSKCKTEGKCIHCDCIQPLAMMTFDHECSMEAYSGMLEAEAWAEYKKEKNINFRF